MMTLQPAGVILTARDGLGLATVLARRGRLAALAHRVRERFGIELPRGPRYVAAEDAGFAGTGPGAWLALREQSGNAFAASLKDALGELASISDQSDGYFMLRLTGARVRSALVKLLPIDLHPRAFQCGDVAATLAGHIGVTLWRLEDGADGSPVFDIAVSRSLADSFRHGLSVSAAEFGLIERTYTG